MNWSWPFARLEVTASSLRLTISFFRQVADYQFRPDQIVTLERCGRIPFVWSGIRIVHSREDYPGTIIFWCFGPPAKVLAKIAATGFHGEQAEGAVPRPSGFPLRPQFWVTALVVWNALSLVTVYGPDRNAGPFGIPLLCALAFAVVTSIAILTIPAAQRAVLKPGFTIADVRALLTLVASISGLMLVVFALARFAIR